MARAKEKIEEEVILEPEETIEAGEADIMAALQEIGGTDEVKWQVTKFHPANESGYCATYSSAELSLDRIRDEYGAGKYKIRGLNERNRYIGGKNVSLVGGSKKPEPVQVVKSDAPSFTDMIALMNQSSQRQMDMMMMMQKSQTDMLAAILGNGRANAPAYDPNAAQANMIAMMGVMKDLFKPSETGAVDMLMRGLELGREIGGVGGEGGMDWMSLAAKGLDTIKPALEAQAAATQNPRPLPRPRPQNQPQPARIAAPAPAPAPQPPSPAEKAPTAPIKDEDMNLLLINWIRNQVRILAYQAKRKSDPELYATVFLDNLPPELTEDQLLAQFSQPDALDKLSIMCPEIIEHKAWFEDFKKSVIEMLSEEPEDEEIEEVEEIDYDNFEMPNDGDSLE